MKLLNLFKKRHLKSRAVQIQNHQKAQQTNTSNTKGMSKDEDPFLFI